MSRRLDLTKGMSEIDFLAESAILPIISDFYVLTLSLNKDNKVERTEGL